MIPVAQVINQIQIPHICTYILYARMNNSRLQLGRMLVGYASLGTFPLTVVSKSITNGSRLSCTNIPLPVIEPEKMRCRGLDREVYSYALNNLHLYCVSYRTHHTMPSI